MVKKSKPLTPPGIIAYHEEEKRDTGVLITRMNTYQEQQVLLKATLKPFKNNPSVQPEDIQIYYRPPPIGKKSIGLVQISEGQWGSIPETVKEIIAKHEPAMPVAKPVAKPVAREYIVIDHTDDEDTDVSMKTETAKVNPPEDLSGSGEPALRKSNRKRSTRRILG